MPGPLPARALAPALAPARASEPAKPGGGGSHVAGEAQVPLGLKGQAAPARAPDLGVLGADLGPPRPPPAPPDADAQVNKLMDLIVNSLYSNKEVFLRELVSNASDALDKARFESLQDDKVLEGLPDLQIEIKADEEAKTITIRDTGIGMTKQDLLDCLGTIAQSGTAKYAEALKQSQQEGDANLIGQFGVGFYSAFLVADKVKVQTKNPNDGSQWVWEGEQGSTQYTILPDPGEPLVRGTQITLHVREESEEICNHMKLKDLVKQYSEFIEFPIRLWTSKSVSRQVVDEEATQKRQEEVDKAAKEGEEPEKVDPVMKTEYENVFDWAVQNDSKPLWVRSPKECTPEDYNAFYKSTFKEFLDPMAHNHFNVEGTIEFTGLLFVPGQAGFDQQNDMAKSKNIKLYVKRVFISDEFDDALMPRYLSFVKGVVDSSDLPLNVSREILQESKVTKIIKKQLVKRSLDALKTLSQKEDQADWNSFYESFGRNLKLGVIEDTPNRKALSKLLRFATSQSEDALASLDDYVGRMPEGQKAVYYMAADSAEAAAASPFVEALIGKGYEVVYLTEPIDEVCLSNLGSYNDVEFVDVTKEGLDLGEDEETKKANEKAAEEVAGLTAWMKDVLGTKIESCVASSRLEGSPVIISTSKFGWSANMERVMKSQAMGDSSQFEFMKGKRILEINPKHSTIRALAARYEADPEDAQARDMVTLLHDTALITSGFDLGSPKQYAQSVYAMIEAASGGGAGGAGDDEGGGPVTPEVVEE